MPDSYYGQPLTAISSFHAHDSKLVERAFPVAAPQLWNELPTNIKKASTPTTFKTHLKTFLFCKHYSTVLDQSA